MLTEDKNKFLKIIQLLNLDLKKQMKNTGNGYLFE